MAFESLSQLKTVLEILRIENPAVASVRAAMGNTPAPKDVWQVAFDYDEAHLKRLVKLRPGELAKPGDLIDYCLDFQYEEVQPDLFRFVFPFCLDHWRRELRAEATDNWAFLEHYYPAMARTKVFGEVLRPAETAAVSHFMAGEILALLDRQPALAPPGPTWYEYWEPVMEFSSLPFPLADLWTPWWQAETLGRAFTLLQFASCFIYDAESNPLFDPAEGGPPELWPYEGFFSHRRWSERNLEFLERELNHAGLLRAVGHAVATVTKSNDAAASAIAKQIYTDGLSRPDEVECRCLALRVRLSIKGMCDYTYDELYNSKTVE